ncbi:MAG: hypothetical protein VCD00_08250 [Candidatus Hydrogenedentota bacterium]
MKIIFTSIKIARCIVITLLAGIVITGLTGCGGGGGGGGDQGTDIPSELVGSYSGTILSSFAGNGTISVDITREFVYESDEVGTSNIRGTWTADFSGNINDNAGTLTGINNTNDLSNLSGILDSYLADGCPSTFNAMGGADSIYGTFSAFDCAVIDTGDIILTNVPEVSIRNIDGVYSGSIFSNIAGSGSLEIDLV